VMIGTCLRCRTHPMSGGVVLHDAARPVVAVGLVREPGRHTCASQHRDR